MKYEELFVEILTVVSDVTSLSVVDILTSNREECVDARHILIYTLSVKCNGNVFAYNLLTPVTIAFATASEESAAVAASKVK